MFYSLVKLRVKSNVIAAKAHSSSQEQMFGSNCCQSQILWAKGCNMARTTCFIPPLILLHIYIFFHFACPQLILRSISSFLFFSIFLFCRWNLFPMAIFHLGLILPLVAVCECFQCSFLFLTSYVIDSLPFFFSFYLCDRCFFLLKKQCGFLQGNKKPNLGDAQFHTNAGAKITVNNIILVQFLFLT